MSGTIPYAADAYGSVPPLELTEIPPDQLDARIIPGRYAGTAQFEVAVAAKLDFSIEWELGADDAIVQSSWSASPALTLVDTSVAGPRTTTFLSGSVAGQWHAITNTITTSAGRRDARTFMVLIKPALPVEGSAVFPDPRAAVAFFRRDKLLNLLLSLPQLAGTTLADDALWKKLVAAEAEAERLLRVWLTPREVLPVHPSYDAEAAALAQQGQRVAREPGYDYDLSMFNGASWGLIELLQRPVISVSWMRFTFPDPGQVLQEIPNDWIRPEGRTNKVNIVPTSGALMAPLNSFLLAFMGAGRKVPFMLQVRYRAGIADVQSQMPDLPPLIQRMAALSMVEDLLPAQSGSVSADGLSQTVAFEASKAQEAIDAKLDRMRDQLQGPRLVVV